MHNVASRLTGAEQRAFSEQQHVGAEAVAELGPQMVNRIATVFRAVDTSNNGTIEKEECVALCGGNQEMVDGMMAGLDTNQDGQISIGEWFGFFLKDAERAEARLTVLEEKLGC